ncbi:hypothetical protein ABFX02_06G146700 [Erythranthe guttata]
MSCGGVYTSSSSSNEVLRGIHLSGAGAMSHESEHDLAMMVNDFLENGNSGGGTDLTRYSSDSDSSFSDLVLLADKISYFKLAKNQYESDLLSVINSLALSINERDLDAGNSDLCNASCIRFALVKLLRLSGYDAAVCTSRWQGIGKVPGGDHEYIDVVHCNEMGSSERVIVDVDFRSHFEIARAVKPYDKILKSVPVIYVGSLNKLKQFLQVMVEAARSSLKQNSMPLPPWRSFAYLEAKWQSPYQRKFYPNEKNSNRNTTIPLEHKNCAGHLRRLHSSLLSEIEIERTLRPFNRSRREKLDKRRRSSFQ